MTNYYFCLHLWLPRAVVVTCDRWQSYAITWVCVFVCVCVTTIWLNRYWCAWMITLYRLLI